MQLSNTKQLLAYACYCGVDAKKYVNFFSCIKGEFELLYLDSNNVQQKWKSSYDDFVHWIWHDCEVHVKSEPLAELISEDAAFLSKGATNKV